MPKLYPTTDWFGFVHLKVPSSETFYFSRIKIKFWLVYQNKNIFDGLVVASHRVGKDKSSKFLLLQKTRQNSLQCY